MLEVKSETLGEAEGEHRGVGIFRGESSPLRKEWGLLLRRLYPLNHCRRIWREIGRRWCTRSSEKQYFRHNVVLLSVVSGEVKVSGKSTDKWNAQMKGGILEGVSMLSLMVGLLAKMRFYLDGGID